MNFKMSRTINKTLGSRDPFFGKIGQRSRSQGHIMYVDKICLNSVPGGPINFILGGWYYDDPPNKWNIKRLPWQRWFLTNRATKSAFYDRIYQKTQRPINFKIGTYLQDVVLVTWPNLEIVGQRSKSYGYIMYSGKMCYRPNSITGGHINFVHRG